MTFDPQHFLDLATNLIGDTEYNVEARYRTSISRAYYAAHLISKEKLEEIGITFPVKQDKAEIHKMVIVSLKNKNKVVGDMLWDLRRKRNEADYDLNTEFNEYGTQVLLSVAETVIKEASNLKK